MDKMIAASDYRELLTRLKSAERIEELDSLKPLLLSFFPKAAVMLGYDQKNSAHPYDLWEHCLHTVLNLPRGLEEDMLYLAAFLHDIGKPDCQCRGKREDDSNMHYYGHPARSAEILREEILPALEGQGISLSPEEKKRFLYYVEYHDDRISHRQKHLNRHLKLVNREEFRNLMLLQVADAKAHTLIPVVEERIRICQTWADTLAIEQEDGNA